MALTLTINIVTTIALITTLISLDTSTLVCPPQPTSILRKSSTRSAVGYSSSTQASRGQSAVYFGQNSDPGISLTTVCSNPNIDIVVLAFVTSFLSTSNWPSLNLASHCDKPTAAQVNAGAVGLLDCVSNGFANEVKACQAAGKPVLLGLCGAVADTTIQNPAQAVRLAQVLSDLFLSSNSSMSSIRPFGNVVLDGFDLDNESGSVMYMDTLLSSLRDNFAKDRTKTYYLSAAPQCPRPDRSIPLSSMQQLLDFVWVQFYNNGDCNLDTGNNFITSLTQWSQDLASTSGKPRLYVGALASVGSGHVEVSNFASIVSSVTAANLSNVDGFYVLGCDIGG